MLPTTLAAQFPVLAVVVVIAGTLLLALQRVYEARVKEVSASRSELIANLLQQIKELKESNERWEALTLSGLQTAKAFADVSDQVARLRATP